MNGFLITYMVVVKPYIVMAPCPLFFRDITVGVPQGSILAPLLFLLFMNDISQCLKYSRCNVYADDVVIYTSSPNINEATLSLQTDLDRLSMWYSKNKLKINIDKTKVNSSKPIQKLQFRHLY